ncbi:MAG: 4-hydroxy-tetrahydrodipicolinate reductase, partial [Clostridia bacterium]|nr:4-hydroxy-tetrahydrodipicolinate reductase [Clostridia bacterium]
TALDIKKAIESVTDGKAEICSIRGGSVIGEHKVVFLGQNQTITITHTALDRNLFVDGVINALDFLKDKESGFYTTKDLINL